MKITIVGGGNIGTQFAVHCSQKNDVTIFTSKPGEFIENIKIIDENDNVILVGKNIKATSDINEAFSNTDCIFITYPAFYFDDIAKIIVNYSKPGLKIGIVPGTGGGECAFTDCILNGATVFGLQRVPSVARLVEKGRTVKAVGYRNELYVASLPNTEVNTISRMIEDIFNIKCYPLPNYLNVTLTPSNPILHTSRLKTIFKDYKEGVFYDKLPLFYEDWDNETSELLLKCDDEVQKICNSIEEFDLSYVKSLKEHYESYSADQLTKKISSIKGFKGLATPSVIVDGKYIPDFNSRYFTADFPYGLSILIQISDFLGLECTNMKDTMNWYKKVTTNDNEYSYEKYGIKNKEKFLNFYRK